MAWTWTKLGLKVASVGLPIFASTGFKFTFMAMGLGKRWLLGGIIGLIAWNTREVLDKGIEKAMPDGAPAAAAPTARARGRRAGGAGMAAALLPGGGAPPTPPTPTQRCLSYTGRVLKLLLPQVGAFAAGAGFEEASALPGISHSDTIFRQIPAVIKFGNLTASCPDVPSTGAGFVAMTTAGCAIAGGEMVQNSIEQIVNRHCTP